MGKEKKIKRYSYIPNDTCSVDIIKNPEEFGIANFLYSTYTGLDTAITIAGISIKCKKYIEEHQMARGRMIYEKYLDHITYMPVLIKMNYYPTAFGHEYNTSTFILRFLLNKDEVKSREFVYPQSFIFR